MVSEHCRAVALVPRPTGPGREYRRGAPALHTVPPDQWLRTDPAVSFTRLVHVFAIPIEYLWRPYQVVIWNRNPRLPASPALAKATTDNVPIAQEPNDLDRRRLLARLGIFVGSVSAAIVGIPSIAFLLGLRRPRSMAWPRRRR